MKDAAVGQHGPRQFGQRNWRLRREELTHALASRTVEITVASHIPNTALATMVPLARITALSDQINVSTRDIAVQVSL